MSYHIHDELDYLSGYQIMLLNDKYINLYKYYSLDQIKKELHECFNDIEKTDDPKFYYGELIEIEKDRYIPVYIKQIHLHRLQIHCLNEIYERNYWSV